MARRFHLYRLTDDDGRPLRLVRMSPVASTIVEQRAAGMSFCDISEELRIKHSLRVSPAHTESLWLKIDERLRVLKSTGIGWRTGYWLQFQLVPVALLGRVTAAMQCLFSLRGALTATAMLIAGCVAVGIRWETRQVSAQGPVLANAYFLFILSSLFHEIGHVSACRRFGLPPRAIGFTFYLVFPAFYSDTSDAWHLPRTERLIIDAAGIYFHLLSASILSMAWMIWDAQALPVAILMIGGATVVNLNPFIRCDGYWLVSDALGVVNLDKIPVRYLQCFVETESERMHYLSQWPVRVVYALGIYSVAWLGFMVWFVYWLLKVAVAPMVNMKAFVVSPHTVDADLLGLLSGLGAVSGLCLLVFRLVNGIRHRFRRETHPSPSREVNR